MNSQPPLFLPEKDQVVDKRNLFANVSSNAIKTSRFECIRTKQCFANWGRRQWVVYKQRVRILYNFTHGRQLSAEEKMNLDMPAVGRCSCMYIIVLRDIRMSSNLSRVSRLESVKRSRLFGEKRQDGKLVCYGHHTTRFSRL